MDIDHDGREHVLIENRSSLESKRSRVMRNKGQRVNVGVRGEDFWQGGIGILFNLALAEAGSKGGM